MSSPYSSPYKEVGIEAQVIKCVSKRRAIERKAEHKQSRLFSGVNDKDLTKSGHDWALKIGRKSVSRYNRPCRLCKKPWFAVEGKPCAGRRPSRTP